MILSFFLIFAFCVDFKIVIGESCEKKVRSREEDMMNVLWQMKPMILCLMRHEWIDEIVIVIQPLTCKYSSHKHLWWDSAETFYICLT